MKKDHTVGTGIGATAGTIAGGVAGSLAGPVGTLAGAAIGGVIGAKVGDETAEALNPTTYQDTFRLTYQDKPYYSTGRHWEDYSPAYAYGYDTHGRYRGASFDEAETHLAKDWERARQKSRLTWAEARHAVRDGWEAIDRQRRGAP